MTEEGNNWDMEVIEDLFESADCEFIQRIPLSRPVSNDSWYWLVDDKGVFTVKVVTGSCKGSVRMTMRDCRRIYGH